MVAGQKFLPLQGINLDLHESLMTPQLARFIKNLVYEIPDVSEAGKGKGGQTGVFKPCVANELYIEGLPLPAGDNEATGYLVSRETKQVFAFIYNSNFQHTIYRLNGLDRTFNIVFQGPELNLRLEPELRIHQGGVWLETFFVADPITGEQTRREFIFITSGFGDQLFIAVEDSIATQSFNATLFPYFQGTYSREDMIKMGVATPKDCIEVTEVPRTPEDEGRNNTLLFNTWQFRLMYVDVWGRPSEHGIISNMYVPGINDCIGASPALPRCLDLKFQAPNPFINQIQVEYRNCNDQQWYLDSVLDLYTGSVLGQWWLRPRNPLVNLNPSTGQITYRFCRDKECQPIPPTETNRLFNPLPRTSQAVTKVGSFINLGNNKEGFLPFTEEMLSKITTVVDPPSPTNSQTRTITLYACIWNESQGNFQSVVKDGTTGYIWGDNNSKHGGARNYLQFFVNIQQSGFLGYLAGTGNTAISTQWYIDDNGQLLEDTDHVGNSLSPIELTLQKFVFTNVPKGRYIFRLASTQIDPAVDANYFKSSTTVWGLSDFQSQSWTIDPHARAFRQEVLIDVCDADFDGLAQNQILTIADTASFQGNQSTKATSGYISEDEVDGQRTLPMELMTVTSQNGTTSGITDHNGFYWYFTRGSGRTFAFNFYESCTVRQFTAHEGNTGMRLFNYFMNTVNNNQYADFAVVPCNRVKVTGRAVIAGTNIGVANANVVLTRGQTGTTGDDGTFTIIAHDDVMNGERTDFVVFSTTACNYSGPNGDCIELKNIDFFPCTACEERIVPVDTFDLSFLQERGLLSGGTYAKGVTGWDWMGRPTFVQPLGYITIPTIIQSQAIGASTLRFIIDPTLTLPPETTYLTFWLTKETTIADYLDWIVDRVEFIDNTGNENNAAPTQIKIFYASIIEYNQQNNFNTTTAWDFIPEGNNTPAIADVVEFYVNGDGKYFTKNIRELVKYNQNGQYFLINYNSDLKDLKANALIRLVRPRVCTGNEGFYEMCHRVDVVNRQPLEFEFVANFFDTYYLSRQIPVPTTIGTGDNATTFNELRSFGFKFEHHSPSDFWGLKCQNWGRVNVKNPYETILYKEDEIAVSGVLSQNARLNFLCYFDDAKKISFSTTNINGIVAIMPETSIVMVIGQDDHFIVGYDDNVVRVNADGQAIAGSVANQYGKPNAKVGDNYGCKLFDKATICKNSGIVMWLDTSKTSLVKHNYSDAIDITDQGAVSFLNPKVKFVQDYNNKNEAKRFFTGVIDPINFEYLITDRITGSPSFLNMLREDDVTAQETVGFSIDNGYLKAFYSFTPECYGYLESDVKDVQLFSFKDGQPYFHYNAIDTTRFNIFYGTEVERIIRIVGVLEPIKEKKYLSFSGYCKQSLYFADQVLTQTGQQSRTLLANINKGDFMWSGAIMCDMNTPTDPNFPNQVNNNKLFEGNMLYGTWVDVRLIGEPSKNTVYSELEGITLSLRAEEKSGTN